MTLTQTEYGSLEISCEAAHQGAIVVDRSDLSMLKFTGKTRLDLINRMSTQKVIDLQSGEGAATVLTSDIGRIIDRLILYAGRKDVYCLTGENNGSNISAYLKRFVFYMDDFHITDLSHESTILALYGPQAGPILSDLSGEDVDLPLHHWKQVALDGQPAYLHRTDPIAGDGYFVMGQSGDKTGLWEKLTEKCHPAGDRAFEYLRIEAGLPRFGHELTLDYIPLEANLWADVSFNKGCYTGQEIIARMESRGRLAKRLVRLDADEPIETGDKLTTNGKSAGTVTSAVDGPMGPLALAYIKSTFLDENAAFMAGDVPVTIRSGG